MSTKKLKPVSRVTLGEQVAAQISESISAGRWLPGDKLPAESELCASLQIGRSTLREAMKSLAYVGMVQMRPGEGTFVLNSRQSLLNEIRSRGLLKTENDLRDVNEARAILEGELAALAAERREPADLENLERLLDEMRLCLDQEDSEYAALDLEFHLAIAKSSKNRLLHDLLKPIRGVMQELIVKSQETPGVKQRIHEHHVRILAAIRQGNPEKAKREMRSHLQAREKAYTLLAGDEMGPPQLSVARKKSPK